MLRLHDIENRLNSATVSGTTYSYTYDSLNQRVFSGTLSGSTYTNELIYFYGADGKKLGVWSLTSSAIQNVSINQWFAGRLLKGEDRLQSVGKYFPYGEDRYSPNPANPANDQEKFATYTRDSATGLDYALNRYYSSVIARFMSADRALANNAQVLPENWNRYAYVGGDPVNKTDPSGFCSPDDDPPCYSGGVTIYDSGGNATGGSVGPPRPYSDDTDRPDPGAYGRGPFRPAKLDNDSNMALRPRLGARLKNFGSSHCASVFSQVSANKLGQSFSSKTFVSDAAAQNFYNGNFDPVKGLTLDQVSGNGSKQTLQQALTSPGGTEYDAVTPIGGPLAPTILGYGFYEHLNNDTFVGNTLLHELMHSYFRLTDSEIFADFAAYGLQSYNAYGNTEAISAWLSTDCRSTPGFLTWTSISK